MKEMYVNHFTLKMFIDGFMNDKHLDMFKKCREEYLKCFPQRDRYNKFIIDRLNALIKKDEKKLELFIDHYAIDYFKMIFDIGMFFEENEKLVKLFDECYKYLMDFCDREDDKLYWQEKFISEEYINEDIIITDPCYIRNTPCDLKADTIYGDWGCTVYNKDTKEKLGRFCADAGEVCIVKLKDVLRYNPDFEKDMKEHDWCFTLIKNFTGTVYIKYKINETVCIKNKIKEFEYEGKLDRELCCYVEGIGNINFIAGQTDF